MLLGEYRDRPGGGKAMPHIVVLSITRAAASGNSFVVSIHEEGTAVNWCHRITLDRDTQAFLIGAVADLHEWSLSRSGLSVKQAQGLAARLGQTLYRSFVGRAGTEVLRRVRPSAVMLAVDEQMLSLPWELMPGPDGAWLYDVPLGRIVTTGYVPERGRDPKTEDPVVRILVVANPTGDLDATDTELDALVAMAGQRGDVRVEVTALARSKATRRAFRAAVRDQDFDIIHVAGHGGFSELEPGQSALLLRDGRLVADDVARLAWTAPPYIVFNSACESARARRGRRLMSRTGQTNGLAAAFLAAGAEAYVGHFWPVDDWGAATFATTFYEALISRANVGTAILEARRSVMGAFFDHGQLTSPGAVFFGDAGSAERRDLASAT